MYLLYPAVKVKTYFEGFFTSMGFCKQAIQGAAWLRVKEWQYATKPLHIRGPRQKIFFLLGPQLLLFSNFEKRIGEN